MEESNLREFDSVLSELKEIFSFSATVDYLIKNHVGIVVILDYIKARDWPWKGHSLINKPIEKIPLVWAIFYAVDSDMRIVWDMHPAKCFPILYNQYNPNVKKYSMPIIKENNGTLGGCSRTRVTISNRAYEINEKTPLYCSIFGLPDDCYDQNFEKRMIDALKSYNQLDLWCFEKTDYIGAKVEPSIRLHYMKGGFLPSKYFLYVDTPEHFLKGIFGSRELESLSKELWYSAGRELIEDMNLDNKDFGFRFEEQANYYLRKRLIYEFIRLSLLLMKKESFYSFSFTYAPQLCLDNKQDVQLKLDDISNTIKNDSEQYIHKIIGKIHSDIDFRSFRNSRFMIMDVEYIHIPYPTANTGRAFNLPCIFSNIIWHGVKENLEININSFAIPCYFCKQYCKFFINKFFNYNCLNYGFEFIEKQVSLVEEMLLKYEGFKIYTYGRSDIFQLEQGSVFFSESFQKRRYERRNRKRAQHIVDIAEDLSIPDKALNVIEQEILEKWLVGWARTKMKVNVNTRFMTPYDNPMWENNYIEAVNSCVLDAVSLFLYLIYNKYRKSNIPIKYL